MSIKFKVDTSIHEGMTRVWYGGTDVALTSEAERRSFKLNVFQSKRAPGRMVGFKGDFLREAYRISVRRGCGFLMQSADPRLHDAGLANFNNQTDLTGSVLRSQGVDNGIIVALNDAAGRPFLAVSNISTAGDGKEDRSQAMTRTWQYEAATLPVHPQSLTE